MPPVLTGRHEFDKTESVSECLDIRRLSPVTWIFTMPKKHSQAAGRKPRSDAQQNRDRILEVAKTAFTRSGAHASLDDIAKQAGVGPGNFYRPFPTPASPREALLPTRGEKVGGAPRGAVPKPPSHQARWD